MFYGHVSFNCIKFKELDEGISQSIEWLSSFYPATGFPMYVIAPVHDNKNSSYFLQGLSFS